MEAYEAWRDADDAVSEAVPGKIKALTRKPAEFFAYLDTIDDSDEDEDEEGDEEEDGRRTPAPVPI